MASRSVRKPTADTSQSVRLASESFNFNLLLDVASSTLVKTMPREVDKANETCA